MLSIYYQSPARFTQLDKSTSTKDLILLKKALQKKNRFLAWFSIRYYADICRYYIHKRTYTYYRRRIQEAAMFRLNNKDENNNIEYFSTSIDIFSYLNFNFKEANTARGLNLPNRYTYLSFLQTYSECTAIDRIATTLSGEYNKYHTTAENYYSYVSNEEFTNITTTLSPYLDYINFTFAKGTISQYALENIYVLADTRDCENLTIALQERGDTRKLTALLIICLKSNRDSSNNTPTYSFKQPSNTFLSIVVFEGAKLDVSGIDTRNSEILYAKSDTTNNIIVHLLLGSKQSMKKENDNTLKAIGDMGDTKETYIFEKAPHSDDNSHLISPILRIYNDKINNTNDFIEIHNFAKDEIGEDNINYILGSDCKQRYFGISLHLADDTTPHNTDCSHEGNFEVIVQNLNLYGLNKDDKLYLYDCENKQQLERIIKDDYSATFSLTLNLPQQDEVSQRNLSSHIVIDSEAIKNDNESIAECTHNANANFQINKLAKLAKRYIITDAKLKTSKTPLQTKPTTLRVKEIVYEAGKAMYYKPNDEVMLKAKHNKDNPSKEDKDETKWAYILTDSQNPPQNPSSHKMFKIDKGITGETYQVKILKEYFNITKTNYLYIYAYMGSPSPKVCQCLRIAYPLSLKYSHNNTFHIIEYGEIQGQYNIQALRIDKNIHDRIYYID